MSDVIYRVQDRQGRGPWRPGLSAKWVVPRIDHDALLPWTEQFSMESIIGYFRSAEGNLGCGCRTLDQLRRWFIPAEWVTLRILGYSAVEMQTDKILAENDIQLVFVRHRPLRSGAKKIELYP